MKEGVDAWRWVQRKTEANYISSIRAGCQQFCFGFFLGWDNFLKVYQSVTEDAVFVSSCIVFPLNLDDSNEHRARFHQGIKVKNWYQRKLNPSTMSKCFWFRTSTKSGASKIFEHTGLALFWAKLTELHIFCMSLILRSGLFLEWH